MNWNYEFLLVTIFEITELQIDLSTDEGKLVAKPASRLPENLIRTIQSNREKIYSVVERSEKIPACRCGGNIFAIPTFDGFENFECLGCGRCCGCQAIDKRIA